MKRIVATTFATILLLLNLSANAQQKRPDDGFWVVQNNVASPKQSVVYFYSTDQTMIYKEEISGVRINLNKRKTVKRLNAALREAVLAWNQKKGIEANSYFVYNRLK